MKRREEKKRFLFCFEFFEILFFHIFIFLFLSLLSLCPLSLSFLFLFLINHILGTRWILVKNLLSLFLGDNVHNLLIKMKLIKNSSVFSFLSFSLSLFSLSLLPLFFATIKKREKNSVFGVFFHLI